MARVLLLLPTSTYRTADLLRAAGRLGVDVVVASEEPSTFEDRSEGRLLTLDWTDPKGAAARVAALHRRRPLDAVIPVDEDTAVVAAAIAEALGLPFNPPEAARAARDKSLLRRRLAERSVLSPAFRVVEEGEDLRAAAAALGYPLVLKPLFLSGSRGVLRVDGPEALEGAAARIRAILDEPAVRRRGGVLARRLLLERYVPGAEVAVEGLLTDGRLRVLALFDKPEPLEGPTFAETLYVTPSRLPAEVERAVVRTAEAAAAAIGLRHGPVHAELRLPPGAPPVVVEIAGRSIGGLCSRTLRFGLGLSLEELVLRHALGENVEGIAREGRAAGVLMLPVPRAGTLEAVRGVEAARAVAGIEDVAITIPAGARLVPLPEGDRYLGFVFARAGTPEEVEGALREAWRRLEPVVVE